MKRITCIIFLLFVFHRSSYAQLCQGSLGPAIRNTTFGSGSNPGAPLGASYTNYNYVSSDCPADGSYTIRSSTTACYGNTWHTLTSDHTGDANGYFMLVNASFTAGDFYVDTVRGLCSGTTFEFASWIINMLKPGNCNPPILPNLTFRIERTDGSLIQSYSTGDIASVPVVQWQQVGFFFTTPAGVTDVVLRITNNAVGGCGNDLALDDITFRPCGPLLTPSITGQSSTSVSYCEGPAAFYTFNCAVSAGFTNPAFQWQVSSNGNMYTDIPGAVNNSLAVSIPPGTLPGSYRYRMLAAEAGNIANNSCRIASVPLTITIDSIPDAVVNTNSPVCEGGNLLLNGSGGGQYSWSGPGGFTSTNASETIINASATASGRYYLQATSSAGCTGRDSADVIVNPSPTASVAVSNATICQGNSIQLGATGGSSYLWSPAGGLSAINIANPVASPVQNTNYQVVVSNSFNCSDTAWVQIDVENSAVANAGADKVTIAGTPVQLQGSAGGTNISYQWSPSLYLDDAFMLNPTIQNIPPGEYVYTLSVSSACGMAADVVKVTVYKDLYIPTAFTPNNDGRNDTWIIPALSAYKDAEIEVYNRYGVVIYRTTNPAAGWDGTYKGVIQPGGVYVYLVKMVTAAGERIYKGVLTLVR